MGHGETDEVPGHTEPGQEKIETHNIQHRSEDVIPYGGVLLPQAFVYGVGNGIAVEHGDQRCVECQSVPWGGVLV